jgi:hypothetical protein
VCILRHIYISTHRLSVVRLLLIHGLKFPNHVLSLLRKSICFNAKSDLFRKLSFY